MPNFNTNSWIYNILQFKKVTKLELSSNAIQLMMHLPSKNILLLKN